MRWEGQEPFSLRCHHDSGNNKAAPLLLLSFAKVTPSTCLIGRPARGYSVSPPVHLQYRPAKPDKKVMLTFDSNLRKKPEERDLGLGTKIRKSNTRKSNRRAEVQRETCSSIKLPLELDGTDKQVALGARVLLEANIAPLQDAPVADPTPLAVSRSGRLLSPNVCHTDIVP